MSCQAVVLPELLPAHMSGVHKAAKIKVNMTIIQDIVQQEGLLTVWPTIPTSQPQQFEGLECELGVHCPFCPAVYPKFKTMADHAYGSHASRPHQGLHIQQSYIQRFSHGSHSWFPVRHRAIPPPTFNTACLVTLRKKLDEEIPIPLQDVDHRHVSPWLATTRWHVWLKEQQLDVELLAMSAYPDSKDEWALAIPYIRRYMVEAYNLIPRSGELCCQILNTDTITK